MSNSNTQITTEEGNKLIAEFIEFDIAANIQWYENEDKVLKSGKHPMIERDGTVDDLQYHTSWDWLRPVIDKIKKYWVDDFCPADKVCCMLIVSDIDDVWQACVDFIKNFNTPNQ